MIKQDRLVEGIKSTGERVLREVNCKWLLGRGGVPGSCED